MAHTEHDEVLLLTKLANTIVRLSKDGTCNILRNVCDGELPNDAINKGQLDGLVGDFLDRLDDLENGELIAINKEVITGTSGSITPPTGGVIELDRFDSSKDAILSKVDANGNPSYETPLDASGNPVTVSLDINGNYITSGVYTDAEVALIYAYSIARKNFDPVDSIGYELLDLNASEVLTLLLSNPDVNVVTDDQKDALDNANTPNALNPVATINDLVNDKHYTHSQGTASAIWNVNHGLGKEPAVSVTDSAGTVVTGDVQYIDLNNVTICFSASFAGSAHFN